MKEEINVELEEQKKVLRRQEFIAWLEGIKKEKIEALRKEKIKRPDTRIKVPKVTAAKAVKLEVVVDIDKKLFENVYFGKILPTSRNYTFNQKFDKRFLKNVRVSNLIIPKEQTKSEFVFDRTQFNDLHRIVFDFNGILTFDKNISDELPKIDKTLFSEVKKGVMKKPEIKRVHVERAILDEKCGISVPQTICPKKLGSPFDISDVLAQHKNPAVPNSEDFEAFVNFDFSVEADELQLQMKDKIANELAIDFCPIERRKDSYKSLSKFRTIIDESRFENVKIYENMLPERKNPYIQETTSYKMSREIPDLTCPAREMIFDVLKTI